MSRYILLTLGYKALVDDEDYVALSVHNWTAQENESGYTYARRNDKGRKVFMHRQVAGVLDAGREVLVDHKNHDTLDNRRENLLVATRKQNAENTRGGRSNTGVLGVHKLKSSGKYLAYLVHNHKFKSLGTFGTVDEAAAAAKEGRERYFTNYNPQASTNLR